MKKISIDEEFHAPDGYVWMFSNKEGSLKLDRVRKSGRVKEFVPPTLDEVKEFFKSKGYTEEAAMKFYDYYNNDDGSPWKDGKGQLIKDYKKKAKSVWFRDEYRIPAAKQSNSKAESKFLF